MFEKICNKSVLRVCITQLLIFISLLTLLWGSQKLYSLIDPVVFPNPSPVEYSKNMTEKEKGVQLIDDITYRLQSELNSTFGWSANDLILGNLMDNREYRQFGVYNATKAIFDFYSLNVAKLGNSSKENDYLYEARMNYFAISPSRFAIPSSESSYKKGLELIENYKKDLANDKAVYNARPDDIYEAFKLITGDRLLAFAIGLLQESQTAPFYKLDNNIYEVQGMVLVIRDFFYSLYTLYPEITNNGNEENFKVAMEYLDKICTYNPLLVTSTFNSPELVLSYLIFARNRIEDIQKSIRI